MRSYIEQIRAHNCQAVRCNVTGMERKEPEAISNGPVIVIHRYSSVVNCANSGKAKICLCRPMKLMCGGIGPLLFKKLITNV